MAILAETDIKLNFPGRLQKAVTSWQDMTKPANEHRKLMFEYYASGYFNDKKDQKNHPINLIMRGVDILVPYIVMGNPKVLVTSRVTKLKSWAETTALALHHLFDEMKLSERTLRIAAINSMFAAGITKTGIMKKEEVEFFGYLHDIGQPYCDSIDFEDYIADVSARDREECEIEGHRYRMPTELAKEFFGPKHADFISSDYTLYGKTAPETIAKQGIELEHYRTMHDYSEFIDLWIPEEDIIVTIMPEGKGKRLLRTVDWDGPEGGPFDFLGYKKFPGSLLPIPPVFSWLDMDTMINTLVNKMRRQADREKTVLAYEGGAEEDAERITKTTDGGSVRVDNLDRVKEVSFGGVNPGNYEWVNYIEGQFSLQGGNLYTLGGRNTQAETLGQEQMMQANASRMLEDMVNQMHLFVKSITKKLAWFLWTDPFIEIPVIKRIPGVMDLEIIFSQEAKEGDFYDFNFDIEPYSMQRMNPEVRYQKFIQLLNQWVIPMMPMAAQQGSVLNVDAVTKILGQYLDIKNIDEWWKSGLPQDVNTGPYQPMQGTVKPKKSGQSDGRFDYGGNKSSRQANSDQQQARAGGQSSPPQK